ncbi:acetyl/propionyl/methylcrotonyl-CoA carboxylase subunit alpha [Chelativorans sp. M5D2P16]|uniref:acetyl/propionyl/methylcrotonyl-CoA carboxylase subunit alpha n=1 Tax=Chelativorans sp. M5D2P16 TaxID=3095678 RepID=UPI002ACAE46E|nr:acetyl/propionyl/methylcrotonyl-CoA carboxylase subunit alpha [Chelativorans sp. M5D2P16]MDZ5698327.1 acetyl/propionyl/methylcrotonyl-CoA carboxylase subunit alpha [Chelativorans sp. M5D2P16]
MFKKILIANRGEIAVRIIRTAQRLGIATVAVHSDADARALHVAMADEAVHIGPSPASESYLDGARIIAAAQATGAEAVHPGYGFLSENPDFVEAVERAGLVFIGPSASAVRAMGLKDAAKRLMEKAGVPVVPGYHGEAQELVVLATKAREIGYPVLIKARAGGGGKGMRRVDDPDRFSEALAGAKREAKAVFGDARVIVEKLVEKPRHIECQVFGDRHGNVVHLFERDCSAQRRHQKVVEEAPAPGMTRAMRMAMTDAAVKAAQAIGYRGAGTVEFIADASKGLKPDRFWFMEMNTRLQVEHPVTEMVTGVDLVEWQLRVAAGEALPLPQEAIALQGHAIEARLYAEDPTRDFLPATGRLHHLRFPERLDGANLRIDTGVRAGDIVSPHYDPMIAKLIVHASDREHALAGLRTALGETRIAGCTVNAGFLARLIDDPDFAAGQFDTGLIERHREALIRVAEPDGKTVAQAALAASGAAYRPEATDPFEAISAYAHYHPPAHRRTIHHGGRALPHAITGLGDGRFAVLLEGTKDAVTLSPAADRETAAWPGHVTLFRGADSHTFALQDPLEDAEAASGGESLRAPMPGLVKLVRATAGEKVKVGQPLLVLEAMKMEHTVTAPHDGIIAEIAAEGAQVSDGTVLVRFAEAAMPSRAGRTEN